jgi:hypothetical protein
MGHASGAYAASLKKSARRARRPDDADMPAIPADVIAKSITSSHTSDFEIRTSRAEPMQSNVRDRKVRLLPQPKSM